MDKRSKIDKDKLYELYVNRGLSGRDCAKQLGVGKSAVLKFIKRFGWSRPQMQNKDEYGRFIRKGQVLPPQEGVNHPNWVNGSNVSFYRRLAFENLPNECYHCGSKDKLEVHHKNKDRKINTIDNLRIVCSWCHRLLEHEDNYENQKRDELGRFTS